MQNLTLAFLRSTIMGKTQGKTKTKKAKKAAKARYWYGKRVKDMTKAEMLNAVDDPNFAKLDCIEYQTEHGLSRECPQQYRGTLTALHRLKKNIKHYCDPDPNLECEKKSNMPLVVLSHYISNSILFLPFHCRPKCMD